MRYLHFTLFLLILGISAQAQETLSERVFVHTDKDCYVAGEDILVKFFVTDSKFKPSTFSKVGYIEICDTEKPQMQFKLSLENGSGNGKLSIPLTIPSGIYELSGYTRYMQNEREDVSFKRQIAIINLARPSEADRIRLTDPDSIEFVPVLSPNNIRVATDQKRYANRSKVTLNLEGIPAGTTDLTIAVSRNDSTTVLPYINKEAWLKKVAQTSPISDWKWQPEYEGHIIMAKPNRHIPVDDWSFYSAGIGFVGRDNHYIHGQQTNSGNTLFYTQGIYGPQEVVTSVMAYNNQPFQMDILSPFAQNLPKALPALSLGAEDQRLMDRFVGVQLQQVMGVDSLEKAVPLEDYYYFSKPIVYDLDQYTRFNTVQETIIEFITYLAVRKTDKKKHIRVLITAENRFSTGNTLILLDGTPIRNHEELLEYNPRNIRYIQIYEGRYCFGGELFECMVSFVSHRQNLSAIQLRENSQLVAYDCPSLPVAFTAPEYPDNDTRQSLTPDFRHTLYWNPNAEKLPQPGSVSFYTSDLCGEFNVTVEGFTKDGKAIQGSATFRVER